MKRYKWDPTHPVTPLPEHPAGEWMLYADHLAVIEKWQTNCTGRHGSQMPCGSDSAQVLRAPDVTSLGQDNIGHLSSAGSASDAAVKP